MSDTKLLIDEEVCGTIIVRIEVNAVRRGTVYTVENRPLVSTVANRFIAEWTIPVLSDPELYGGKLVAARDRQHPRDVFDIDCRLFKA